MTAPLPPQSGPTSAQERLAAEDHGTPPDIQAPLPDVASAVAAAESSAHARVEAASALAESPQGFGSDGYNPSPSDAGTHWNTDMQFPHQGP